MREILEKSFFDSENVFEKIDEAIRENKKLLIVTLNPEGVMGALKDSELKNIFMREDTLLVCESVGVEWSIKKILKKKVNRYPGIDLFKILLEKMKKENLGIYLYGATEEVISAFVSKLKNDNINILGYRNGYNVENEAALYNEISSLSPNLIAFALGVGRQEKALNEVFKISEKGIFIGVGGSFDVLSGTKKRAPVFFQKTKTEWLYRICKEPKRLPRFFNNNIKFVWKVLKTKYLG